MALSKSAVNELRRELADLGERRNQIDSAICGIKAILSAAGVAVPEARSGAPGSRAGGAAAPGLAGSGRQVPLRTRIIEIIGSATRASRATVVEQLRSEGFRVGGATSLPVRVSHELSRLRRTGILRRDRNGMFTVAAKSRELATGQRAPESFAAVG